MGHTTITTFHLTLLIFTFFLGLRVPTKCIQLVGTEGVIANIKQLQNFKKLKP